MNKNTGNIILIGFMGSGKTTFGKWLAANYNMAFCDTDAYIVNQQNMSINDIFAKHGEAYFRDLETACVKELQETLHNTVVSVGGGLPVREENRRLLKELGQVVYLRTSLDELVKRLSNDTTRPLLAGGDVRNKIQTLMQAREAFYTDAADVMLDTDGQSFADMYAKLHKEI